jgi:predicted nucleic acid-binding protein
VRIFLDTSVLLAACRSKFGASRAIIDIAAKQGWKLTASPWVRNEVEKNLSKFPFESSCYGLPILLPSEFLIRERNQGRLR